MILRSLRLRLLAAASLSLAVALPMAGFGLVSLFGKHVERQLEDRLEHYLVELIGSIEPDQAGGIELAGTLNDPRFQQPLSGLYWQIQDDEHQLLIRSRSLWDSMLELPRDKLALNRVHRHQLPGPDEQQLLVREQQVIVFPETSPMRIRVAVALDRSDLLAARAGFARDLLPYLVLLALMLLGTTWLQVRTGLRPLDSVRRGVQAVRNGDSSRIAERYPDEVQPLADEINELLEARDRTVAAARAWTADLAHGLKTPLAALTADVQRLRARGEIQLADDLEQTAQAMRQRVDRELIRARLRNAAAGPPQHAALAELVGGVLKTLQRTPDGSRVHWQVEVPAQAQVRMAPGDLAELLGNLLENAAKWARGQVRITALRDTRWTLTIDDDGPGVPEAQRASLGQRGVRLDEQVDGSGFGLAIVRDIVDAYGVHMDLRVSDLGGLCVQLSFPSPAP